MRRKTILAAALLVVAVLASHPVVAEFYTVNLTNGNSFDTRYEPRTAEWDASKVLFLTDVGNWIAVDRADVAEVVSEVNTRGFGLVIDSDTIAIGWSPNDAPELDDADAADPTTRLLNFLEARDSERPNYNVDQFVDPSQAGSGGLPAWDLAVPGRGSGRRDIDLIAPGLPAPPRFPTAEGGTGSVEPNAGPN